MLPYVAVVIATACSGNRNSSADDKESEAIVEIAAEVTADDVWPDTEPVVEPTDYVSADRRTFGLRGPVKSVTTYYVSLAGDERISEVLFFDQKGFYRPEDAQMTRDENGRITEITYTYDPGGERYGYGPTGMTASVTKWDTSTSTEVYEVFDIYDNPKTSLLYGEDGPDGTPDGKNTYRYLEWDGHGNWTERMVYYEYNGDPEWNSNYSQRREIEYY